MIYIARFQSHSLCPVPTVHDFAGSLMCTYVLHMHGRYMHLHVCFASGPAPFFFFFF